MDDVTTAPGSTTVEERMDEVRQRTLQLVAPVDWATLRRQHIPILSPMVWDLGHIGNFEEIWIAQRLAGRPPLAHGYQKMFDPVVNPRPTREALPLPERDELLDYLERVRAATRQVLLDSELPAGPSAAPAELVEMVAQHEEQHQETLLQCLQVLEDPPYRPAQRHRPPPARPVEPGWVAIPAGAFAMGRDGDGFAYDNERPRHRVELPAFRIARFPITHGDWLAFMEASGYRRRELWSDGGWQWLWGAQSERVEAPRHWHREAGRWQVRFMDRALPLAEAADLPVVHVCWWEANAYARWAGARLPTEAEWEKAALFDPATEESRPWPWGDEPPTPARANLDQLAFAPAPIGAYPHGASAFGVEQMIGDVWEWTASDFGGYPGFVAHPYEEYSQIFFGPEYKVLRGGSWATRPAVARGTFRNWDFPLRRQIFSGLRLAADV